MSEETWKPVVGYEGLYEVSDVGNIRSLYGSQGTKRVLKMHLHGDGYRSVRLCRKGGPRVSVHRIVAKAFIENPLGKKTVNHKNGDRQDNRVSNLEWATQKEQVQDALVRNGGPWANKGFKNHKCAVTRGKAALCIAMRASGHFPKSSEIDGVLSLAKGYSGRIVRNPTYQADIAEILGVPFAPQNTSTLPSPSSRIAHP